MHRPGLSCMQHPPQPRQARPGLPCMQHPPAMPSSPPTHAPPMHAAPPSHAFFPPTTCPHLHAAHPQPHLACSLLAVHHVVWPIGHGQEAAVLGVPQLRVNAVADAPQLGVMGGDGRVTPWRGGTRGRGGRGGYGRVTWRGGGKGSACVWGVYRGRARASCRRARLHLFLVVATTRNRYNQV